MERLISPYSGLCIDASQVDEVLVVPEVHNSVRACDRGVDEPGEEENVAVTFAPELVLAGSAAQSVIARSPIKDVGAALPVVVPLGRRIIVPEESVIAA